MPHYTKDQLNAFVADRRYWDRKHPEHEAHLDFTAKAFEETYPDPVPPTPEQEAWAEEEEKRLRDLAKLRPFWDKRDPDHARARAEVSRGFDKINAVLYGTPDPDASAGTPKPETRDLLDPVMPGPQERPGIAMAPAPNLLQRANQLAQAGWKIGGHTSALSDTRQNHSAELMESPRPLGMTSVTSDRQRKSTILAAENATRPNPPKVIHPEISAPPGIDGRFIWSPLMVTPSQIEILWKDLENPKDAFDSFKQGFQHDGTQVTDPTTGQLRPPTEKELEIWFEQWQQHIRDFLQDYYEKKDSLFPEEGERVPPLNPIPPENPVG